MKLFKFNKSTGKRGAQIETPFSNVTFSGARFTTKSINGFLESKCVDVFLTISTGRRGEYSFEAKDAARLGVDAFCFCTGRDKATGKFEWAFIAAA